MRACLTSLSNGPELEASGSRSKGRPSSRFLLFNPSHRSDRIGACDQKLLGRGTGNLRACQPLLGHMMLGSTARYLGIEVDDTLVLSEQTDL